MWAHAPIGRMVLCNKGLLAEQLSKVPWGSAVVGAISVTRLGYADRGELLPKRFLPIESFVRKN